ncbi:MAG: prenyltransferase [Candidatus Methanomethylophilaceae archaeon]|nr:prenyltransferase [Candidatus Methanomethylophilaceae archaeon]
METPKVKPVKAGWWNAFRPWTLHGAVVPVLIGGFIAFRYIDVDIAAVIILILTVIAGCLLQSAANLLNTYGDYQKGTDTVENETRSPELVTGVLKPKHVLWMGLACLGLTCLIGIVFIFYIGWKILIFGALAMAGAGLYTAVYKYHALGQVNVFVMMGVLMPLGTYFVLTGELAWEPVVIGLPNAFLITGVLGGNEMRDYYDDKEADVGTLMGHFSYRTGMAIYRFESVIAFVILAVLLIIGYAPWPCALAFLSAYDLYVVLVNSSKAAEDKHASFMLVPLCFKLNWHFGVLLSVGYLLYWTLLL